MESGSRIQNEMEHGRFIAEFGEEVWNWSSPAGRARWRRRVQLFLDFLGDRESAVLEIGCGTGLFTQELARSPHRITAIDISRDLIEIARQRVAGSNVVFVCGNAYATTFPDRTFDAIVGSSCLHHLELIPALNEFYRLLKPGGSLMFTEPNMLNPQIAVQKNIPFFKRLAGDSPDETAFVRFQLRNTLIEAGYMAVSIVPFDFVHPALPGFLLKPAIPALLLLEKLPLIREIAGSLIIRATKPGNAV